MKLILKADLEAYSTKNEGKMTSDQYKKAAKEIRDFSSDLEDDQVSNLMA